jgi:S1-C subfamily serine protease
MEIRPMTKRISVKIAAMLALALVVALAASSIAAQEASPRPFLGVAVEAADGGVRVVQLVPGGAAAAAGLARGDIIVSLNGNAVTAETLGAQIGALAVGDTVELEVRRGDETLTLTAALGEQTAFSEPLRPGRPSMPLPPALLEGFTQRDRPLLGVALDDTEDGVAILEILPGSPAEVAGFQAGDVIVSVNDVAAESARALVQQVRVMRAGDALTVELMRDGETQTVEAVLASGRQTRAGLMPIGSFDLVVYDSAANGWRVLMLDPAGALAQAGLSQQDAITQVDGQPRAAAILDEYLEGLDAGATVVLTVERDGETREVEIAASDMQAVLRPFDQLRFGQMPHELLQHLPMMAGGQPGRVGVAFAQLDAETAAEHGVDETEGALILEVAAGSPAQQAGLEVGDIVVAVNGDAVDAERTLRDRLSFYRQRDVVTLTVLRAGETLEIEVTLGQPMPHERMGGRRGFGMPFGDRRGPRFGFPDAVPAQPATEATPSL